MKKYASDLSEEQKRKVLEYTRMIFGELNFVKLLNEFGSESKIINYVLEYENTCEIKQEKKHGRKVWKIAAALYIPTALIIRLFIPVEYRPGIIFTVFAPIILFFIFLSYTTDYVTDDNLPGFVKFFLNLFLFFILLFLINKYISENQYFGAIGFGIMYYFIAFLVDKILKPKLSDFQKILSKK